MKYFLNYTYMSNDILRLINNDDWTTVLQKVQPILKVLDDGRTLFHYACIRGQKQIIKSIMALKSIEIYKSDLDGNTGCHLLALSSWDNLLFELIEMDNNFLKIKNNQDQFIFNIVINRPETLELIIDAMKKFKLESYLNYVRSDGKTFLLDLIKITEKTNNKIYYEILKKIEHYDLPKSRLPLNYALEKGYMTVAKFIVDNIKMDLNLCDENSFNPLILSLLYKEIDFAKLLLKSNINVNFGGSENRYIPLSIIIKYDLFDLYYDLKRHNLNYNNADNVLNIPAFYLIQHMSRKYDKSQEKIYKDILINSDLNFSNFQGTTCMHLLVKYNLWEKFTDILENIEINPNLENTKGENILSYLKENKLQKFVGIIDKQINKGIFTKITGSNDINLPISIDAHDFGIFNADSIHNMTYLMYILTKYNNATVPVQYPNEEKQMWDVYITNLGLISNKNNDPMTSTIGFYVSSFYSISPHIIFWRDKYFYYVNRHIKLYLERAIKSNKRFIIIKLTLSPTNSLLHSNMVLYDKKRNTLMRFEPYGDWDLADSYHLDKLIRGLFEDILNKDELKKFTFIRPNEYLDKTKFQSTSLGDDYNSKNLGDPEGYCLAWSYWFLELKLLNPDVDEKDLVKNAFISILKIDKNSTNPILQHIRGYAKHLDKEKNSIFDLIGIPKQLHYKLNFQKENVKLLTKYVDDYVIKQIEK